LALPAIAGAPSAKPTQPDVEVKATGRRLDWTLQVMQVPAQPGLLGGARRDLVIVMVDQQPNLELGALQSRHRQRLDPLGQRCPRDGDRVDPIRLPALAGALTRTAISFGGTRTIRSPRASKKRFSRPETCRPSSIAHTRSTSSLRAHRNTRSKSAVEAFTASLLRSSPVAATAAANAKFVLCGSDPITIIHIRPFVGDSDEADLRSTHLSRGGCHAPIKSGRRSSGGGERHNQCRSDQPVDTEPRSRLAADPGPHRPARTSPPGTTER
jgi:hypothetical protein